MHVRHKDTLVYPSGIFNPSDWLRFIQLNLFDKEWADLGLDDNALRALQIVIMAGPERHPVVRNSGGMRKIRFAEKGSNVGKSGAYRVGYAFFPEYETVLLVTVWGKNEKSTLTMNDTKAIASIIREIQVLLDKGKT